MNEVELTRLSSKGQIVIPQHTREKMGLKEGETFAMVSTKDTIILKKIDLPSQKEMFERLHKWGVNLAKKKGLKEEDLQDTIKKSRVQS